MKRSRHHRVAQMLMRPWTNSEGKVKCRHRRAGRWDPSSPESVMFRRGAYSVPLSQDSEAAEKALGALEGAVDQVLRDLLDRLDRVGPGRESYEVGTWKPNEEEILREFIVCQYSRSEPVRKSLTTAKSADELAEEIANDLRADPELSGKVEVNRTGVEKIHQQLLVQVQLNLGPENHFRKHFVNMETVIGMLDLNAPKLALTDAPAIKEGPRRTARDDEHGNDAGIPGKDPEVRLVLPVAPQYALMLRMPDGLRGPRKVEGIRRARAIEWLTHMARSYEQVIVPWEDDETAYFFEAPKASNPQILRVNSREGAATLAKSRPSSSTAHSA